MFGKKRWDREKYPENWEQMSYEFRESKDFTCEVCGYRQGDPLISKAGNEYRGSVDAAHRFPNDESNPDPELLCLCKRDHRIYDNTIKAEYEHQENMMEIVQWEYCELCEMRMPPSHFPHG
jgi:hypothetical protein